jgi:hypothetical protein
MLFRDLTSGDPPSIWLLHSNDHHRSIEAGHLLAVFQELRVKQDHGNVGSQLLHLYGALADSRSLRPRGVDLSEVRYNIPAAFSSRFCNRYLNSVVDKKAIESLRIM